MTAFQGIEVPAVFRVPGTNILLSNVVELTFLRKHWFGDRALHPVVLPHPCDRPLNLEAKSPVFASRWQKETTSAPNFSCWK